MRRVKELDSCLMQCICLLFCFKLGWSHMDIRAALAQVFGQETMCPSRTRRWFQSFQNGRTSLVDVQRAHRKKSACTPANIQVVRDMINTDKSITFGAIMTQTGLKQTTTHHIIWKDLMLTLRSAKLLPAFLTPCHIVQRFEHASKMLTCALRTPSKLKKIVTMDEAWCYQYNPETKMPGLSVVGPRRTETLPPPEDNCCQESHACCLL